MIRSPRRSVTRFFIPLIDVLILLFCIFLLMPFVSGPDTPEPVPDGKGQPVEKVLSTDVKELQQELTEARLLIARLEREKLSRLTDRLAVRVLEIDPNDGTLFYYDPAREDIRNDADAVRLIQKQKALASSGGVVKDVFFLILFPRRPGGFPTEPQKEQIRKWFETVPHGFDIPSSRG